MTPDARLNLSRRTLLMAGAATAALAACSKAADKTTAATSSADGTLIATQHGLIRGLVSDGVIEFRGVRYAQPPVRGLRFQAPHALDPWTGEQPANQYGQAAMQLRAGAGAAKYTEGVGAAMTQAYKAPEGDKPEGDEDCLILNVYTTKTGPAAGATRPVMVWIHGGGFSYGQAALNIYRGHNLAKNHDVVFVGINHRLNVFGYLGLDAAGVPGFTGSTNAGMMDLVMALQWVRDNIGMFGGDPNNVTIFGQSGGGAKVSTLLAMPAAKALFHKAIIQSGAGIRAGTKQDAAKTANDFLAKLGIAPAEAVAKLANLPATDLLKAAVDLGGNNFRPSIDDVNLTRHPFDPDAPAQSADIPLMIGFTKDEQTLYNEGNPDWPKTTEAMVVAAAERVAAGKGKTIVAAFKKRFPDYKPPYLLTQVTGTVNSLRSHHTLAARKSAQRAGVYAYVFAHDLPPENFVLKAPHTAEIAYIMDNVKEAPLFAGATETDFAMGKMMSATWVNFARSGDPNGAPGLPQWPKFNAVDRPTMFFSKDSKVETQPYSEVWKIILDNPTPNPRPL